MTMTEPPPAMEPQPINLASSPATGLYDWLATSDHKRIGRTWIHASLLMLLVTTIVGVLIGFDPNVIIYPYWRMVYFAFAALLIGSVFAFLQFTTFGMVVRAGMADRETVGLLGINIDKRFTFTFAMAAVVAGLAGVMYAPINSPNYHMGMDFLVLSFVVVVVGGMGSLPGAVAAGFLLGILESFASMNEIKSILPGIDQIIIYLVAIIILLARPRGLLGRKGVMEE